MVPKSPVKEAYGVRMPSCQLAVAFETLEKILSFLRTSLKKVITPGTAATRTPQAKLQAPNQSQYSKDTASPKEY